MKRQRLFTPGPTAVPESVLLEMAQPIVHHRTEEFIAIAAEVFKELKYVFQTDNDVFILASSGTGAMEAAVVNFLSPGDKVVAISAGKFGERWVSLAKTYGLNVTAIEVEWGKKFALSLLRETLEKQPDIKAVLATLCETSTGTHFDVAGMGRITSEYPETILIVDAISSLGAVPCKTDEWNLDLVVTGSQKALMLPPGLAFISVSPKAWQMAESSRLPKYYFDLKKYKKVLEKNDFPFTMAVSLVTGLRRSLQLIRQRTLEKVWEEHHRRAEATRKAVTVLGLTLFSEDPSDAVTAIQLPEGLDGEKLGRLLRTKYGISVAGGQDHLKGKIVRISHLGWQDEFDVLTGITALGIGLGELGYSGPLGEGLKAASSILFAGR
ncbi:MAG: alanine--glyoxylate aminotransferase family protein [Candidatus Omnitrophica bacterium]|nr:alanine--glyoxylate aminotransferase family protein [Candidatus Omnitrophota bacterium]